MESNLIETDNPMADSRIDPFQTYMASSLQSFEATQRRFTDEWSTTPWQSQLRSKRPIILRILAIHFIILTLLVVNKLQTISPNPTEPPRMFAAGQNHIIALGSNNASIGVRLTHEPLNGQSFSLALLHATNHIMEMAKHAEKDHETFNPTITRWYEQAPNDEWAQEKSGVYVELALEKDKAHPLEVKLVMSILQALHKLRLSPFRCDLVVKDEEGFQYGKGCLSATNGTCY